MPKRIHTSTPHSFPMDISDDTRARRHVLSQQMYRLRTRYRLLIKNGQDSSAAVVQVQLDTLRQEYASIGGEPYHIGNEL